MFRLAKKLGVFGLIILSVNSYSNNSLFKPDDYAYKAELSSANEKLRRVILPGKLLLSLTRADLGDVTIFDKHNQHMPIWIRKNKAKKLQQSIPLSFYEFTENQTNNNSEETTTIVRDSTGNVETYSKLSKPQAETESIRHYVIELPHKENSDIKIHEIMIDWEQYPERRLLTIKVQASDNLSQWDTLQSSQDLAKLNNSDKKPQGQLIKINTNNKYLRLSLNGTITKFKLLSVMGNYNQTEETPIKWMKIGSLVPDSSKKEFLAFNIKSTIPPDGIRFAFNRPNQLLKGDIYYTKQNNKKRILHQRNIVQHNINDTDNITKNKQIELPNIKGAKWWFKPKSPVIEIPNIEVNLPKYELLFLAGGEQPYSIVWGNLDASRPANILQKIIENDSQISNHISTIKIGNTVTLGGKDRIGLKTSLPILKWLLWFILVIVVFIAGRVALNLYKEINKQENSSQ